MRNWSRHLKRAPHPPTSRESFGIQRRDETSPFEKIFCYATLSIRKRQTSTFHRSLIHGKLLPFSVYRWDRRHRLQQQPVGLRWSLVSSVAEVSRLRGQRRRFKVDLSLDFKLCWKNCCCIGKNSSELAELAASVHSSTFNYSMGTAECIESGRASPPGDAFIIFRSSSRCSLWFNNPARKIARSV